MFNFFKKKESEVIVHSVADGKVIETSKVSDDTFAKNIVGKGIAIVLSSGKIFAPCDGEISVCFPTGHAYGIKLKNGCELLIHLGIDTVELKGNGFKPMVKIKDVVKQGDLIAEIDLSLLRTQKANLESPIIVTNESIGNHKIILLAEVKSDIKANSPLYKII